MLTLCLCTYGQRKIKFEYDDSGNLVKRYAPVEYETSSFASKYTLKVGPSPTSGPLHILVFDGRSSQIVCGYRIQIIVHPAVGSGKGVEQVVDKGDAHVDISNPYFYPNGVYVVNVLVFDNASGAPSQGMLKIIKK